MILKRFKSNFIFDALNLFKKGKLPKPIPSSATTNNATSLVKPHDVKFENYKPSLISSVTYGSVQEQYQSSNKQHGTHHHHKNHSKNFNNDLKELISILNLSNPKSIEYNKNILKLNNKEFSKTIKTLSETKILEIIKFLLLQNENIHDSGYFDKLSILVLSPNFLNISKLPNLTDLKISNLDTIKFKIILLRKYNLLHQPIKIIKSLTNDFNEIYEVIKSKELPQYYERIFWFFYFRYNQDYETKIKDLDDIYHTFTIWESLSNHQEISKIALKFHKLSDFHQVFFKIVSNHEMINLIHKHPEKLSTLKKFSINYKIYTNDLSLNFIELITKQFLPFLNHPKEIEHLLSILKDDYEYNDIMYLMNEIK